MFKLVHIIYEISANISRNSVLEAKLTKKCFMTVDNSVAIVSFNLKNIGKAKKLDNLYYFAEAYGLGVRVLTTSFLFASRFTY